MHAGQQLFKSTPADPCKDHLILVEHARAGPRGATATNYVGLARKLTGDRWMRLSLSCGGGRHHHRGLGAAAAARPPTFGTGQ